MDFVFLFLTVTYVVALMVAKRGWNSAMSVRNTVEENPFVSVVVPFRNERQNLPTLLASLKHQTYASYEIMLVNDHSEDDYHAVIESIIKDMPRCYLIDAEGSGKKQAITTGVAKARGSIILTTDADCQMGHTWIADMVSSFNPTVHMVCGGVSIQGNGFFHGLQSIEWCSLVGVTASAIGYNSPVMCSGANLAFRKSTFEEVNGYDGNTHIASGDDEFLMRKIQARYPKGIAFSSRSTAVVITKALDTFSGFFQQRLRWAQKWKYNASIPSLLMAFIVLGFQLVWLVLMWRSFVLHQEIAMICLSMRALAEVYFLFPVSNFLGVRWQWISFFVLQWIYPVYVISVGVLSNFVSINWRGRRIV